MSEIIYPEESYRIMGAGFEIYREKGCGFLEAVHQECLEIEFAVQAIRFVAQQNLPLTDKGWTLRQTDTPDFVCFGRIVVELKAVTALAGEYRAQVHNYLRATGHRLGLLVNFGRFPQREYERVAC